MSTQVLPVARLRNEHFLSVPCLACRAAVGERCWSTAYRSRRRYRAYGVYHAHRRNLAAIEWARRLSK